MGEDATPTRSSWERSLRWEVFEVCELASEAWEQWERCESFSSSPFLLPVPGALPDGLILWSSMSLDPPPWGEYSGGDAASLASSAIKFA